MVKVITYGTFDLLHYGHVRLLKRAKALGDYLIVGVTSDDFDKNRGKINVSQSLAERVEAVKGLGIADEVIVEEYEGQKIDDIRRYDVDIFTVGSDWTGKFDYLKEYCEVVYLDRTEGISSTELRAAERKCRLGLVGDTLFLNKVMAEAAYVNGIEITGICTGDVSAFDEPIRSLPLVTDDLDTLFEAVDAVYIRALPEEHPALIRKALGAGKHVLCEAPCALDEAEARELSDLAAEKDLIFMEGLKTAYATAFKRLILLAKSGVIGKVTSVDCACTSLARTNNPKEWRGIHEWGPTALLPVFDVLGTGYTEKRITVRFEDAEKKNDSFLKIDFLYPQAVAGVKVATGVKSEGELILSGTKGYIYVPAPWWKTDYFEVRFENPLENKRYFYTLDGEGIRYELVDFARAVRKGKAEHEISREVTEAVSRVLHDFASGKDVTEIK